MTALHDLTDTELRRVIAERLGITVVGVSMDDDDYGLGLYDWTFTRSGDYLAGVFADTEDEAWLRAWEPSPDCGDTPLPDWPGDAGVALTACMDVARERRWGLHCTSDAVSFLQPWGAAFRLRHTVLEYSDLPRALAELLAAALEMQP